MAIKERIINFTLLSAFASLGWWIAVFPLKPIISYSLDQISNFNNLFSKSANSIINDDYISELQFKIDLIHYDLDIELFPNKKEIKAEAQLSGVILDSAINRIELNFYDNLKITNLKLNQQDVYFKNKGTRLTVFLEREFYEDTFQLKINYEGKPKRAGLAAFVFGELNGNSVVYNLSEPTYSSTWFPCNDLPSDKALLDIKITNDKDQTSVSNGILVSKTINGDRATYHWKTLYPISTYLICLYSSNYSEFEDKYISAAGDSLPIKYYVFPDHLDEAKVDFKDTPKMIEYFSKTFGEYPFIKEKYGIAEFLWQTGAMEHQTITGIGSNFVSGKNYFEDIYIHELAHHWWGNAVGPASWKDIWLNEGFSTYSEALYAESKFGANALQAAMLSKFSDEFTNTLYDPGKFLFSSTVYDKGAWVLHMLRWEVGDSVFFNILRTYFEKYKYKNASTNDFINICESRSKRDLTKFFDQWVFSGNENIKLDYRWSIKKYSQTEYLIFLEIEQLQEKLSFYEFTLEVEFEYGADQSFTRKFKVDQKKQKFEIIVEHMPNQLIIDPKNWLLANIRDMNSYEN